VAARQRFLKVCAGQSRPHPLAQDRVQPVLAHLTHHAPFAPVVSMVVIHEIQRVNDARHPETACEQQIKNKLRPPLDGKNRQRREEFMNSVLWVVLPQHLVACAQD
jgi:hypothetical protein